MRNLNWLAVAVVMAFGAGVAFGQAPTVIAKTEANPPPPPAAPPPVGKANRPAAK